MDFFKLASYFYITDDPKEMESLGRRIAKDNQDLYTPVMMEKMYEGVESYIPDADMKKKEEMVYRAIYDYWAYGCLVDEEFYLHFDEKTHQEKQEYLVGKLRGFYVDHLNSGGGKEIMHSCLININYTSA